VTGFFNELDFCDAPVVLLVYEVTDRFGISLFSLILLNLLLPPMELPEKWVKLGTFKVRQSISISQEVIAKFSQQLE
jgi:hypothetical protein